LAYPSITGEARAGATTARQRIAAARMFIWTMLRLKKVERDDVEVICGAKDEALDLKRSNRNIYEYALKYPVNL